FSILVFNHASARLESRSQLSGARGQLLREQRDPFHLFETRYVAGVFLNLTLKQIDDPLMREQLVVGVVRDRFDARILAQQIHVWNDRRRSELSRIADDYNL